jgi:excinuclease ABC subunit A
MFSFNNPFGACPECAGLGAIRTISPDKIMFDRTLSLREGAIVVNGFKTIDEETWFGPLFEAVGREYGFTLDTPICEYSPEALHALLYGTGDREYEIDRWFDGTPHHQRRRYEGLVPIIQWRMEHSDNDYYNEFVEELPCPRCHGRRLSDAALSVTVGGIDIETYTRKSVSEALRFISELQLSESDWKIARDIVKEIKARLGFLENVGLEYLTLSRRAGTLSGGEAQRIRLATQIGSSLVGVLYILDEPSIGLHQRDNGRLIATLKKLRDLGNTVIVVEHDEETMLSADYIIDIGPGAGIHGGNVVAAGTPQEIAANVNSITGDFLSGRRSIPIPASRRPGNGKFLRVVGARQNNLKNIIVDFPLGMFVCVTGVSGSGKSSLVNSILYQSLAHTLNGARTYPGDHDKIEGTENLDKIICIDQSPIGRTPRSNPATYTGLFTDIRNFFAMTPDAKLRGYSPGRFSFNVRGGRCEACEGDGVKKIEMHFLPDVYVTCDVCHGKRYNRETLEVKYHGYNINDVLEMTVEEALREFSDLPRIRRKLETLYDVGLGYIKLGQSSTTLSGGEAQRVKLATQLSRQSTGRTIYILDEPTTGLHTADVAKLIDVLNRLVNAGNSVIVIEHNLDIIKTADWIIDLGPEGGDGGGEVVCTGTPEDVAACDASYTGKFLRKKLNRAKVNSVH